MLEESVVAIQNGYSKDTESRQTKQTNKIQKNKQHRPNQKAREKPTNLSQFTDKRIYVTLYCVYLSTDKN
jgi:hypothetical protein